MTQLRSHAGTEELAPDYAPACAACGDTATAVTHEIPETMFVTGEHFTYRECGRCGSLQIDEVPADLASFYPDDYYSFLPSKSQQLKDLAVVNVDRARCRVFGDRRAGADLEWMTVAGVTPESAILDVGCGSGRYLRRLERHGFANLRGTDPFIPESFRLPGGTEIADRALEETDGSFDLVMFHHSFEHTPDPVETIESARRLLAPGGRLLIRVPVVAQAWHDHGVHWIQLDAPRHLHLQTVDGMHQLANRLGLRVTKTRFDSGPFQIWGSIQAERGVGLFADESQANTRFSTKPTFSPAEIRRYQAEADRRNAHGTGDQAGFLLELSSSY